MGRLKPKTPLGPPLPSPTTAGLHDAADRYLHRPLASMVVAGLFPLRVTANQVTLMRLPVGWAAAVFLYRAFFVPHADATLSWLLAGGLLFVAMVLDCADGQLARRRAEQTKTGRILDGIADVLVIFPLYLTLGLGIQHMYGTPWFILTVIAGGSMWAHCIVHDRVKMIVDEKPVTVPAAHEDPHGTIAAPAETQTGHPQGNLKGPLGWIYHSYLRIQDALVPAPHPEPPNAHPQTHPPGSRRWPATLRFNAMLGLGTHVFFLYAGITLMALDARFVLGVQLVFATVLNVFLLIVIASLRANHPTSRPLHTRTPE